MARLNDEALSRSVAERSVPLGGSSGSFDPLLDMIGEARLVLLGEATRGTHELYRIRSHLTKRLIREKGFCAVAVEADWPSAHRVDRYARGFGIDVDAADALGDFERFPTWMWRNVEVAELVSWLRAHNDGIASARSRVGFHGLDLYSLHASIGAVLDHLERTDPAAAERARYRYACFDHFGEDPEAYGHSASFGLSEACERQAVAELCELQKRRQELIAADGGDTLAEDDAFDAEQNARVVLGAEAYHRTMFGGRIQSWNLRDTHMADTLDALLAHLDRRFSPAKIVVWAHNSHVGDARATERADHGEINIGQLVRERHGDDARLIGFSTYSGTVAAASRWGGVAERKLVRPALPGSHEDIFHGARVPDFCLVLRGLDGAADALRESRLERAIGVIYLPESERVSHYFHARFADQFDAVLHVDRTTALQPLDWSGTWERGEVPETFPTGL